jgi:NitT/TauT family transport system permease protein
VSEVAPKGMTIHTPAMLLASAAIISWVIGSGQWLGDLATALPASSLILAAGIGFGGAVLGIWLIRTESPWETPVITLSMTAAIIILPIAYLSRHPTPGFADWGFWLYQVSFVILASAALASLSRVSTQSRLVTLAIPALFGGCIIYGWEVATVGAGIPAILLPPPSQIGYQLVSQASMLWADFQQTFLKSVLAGFAIGCGLGFVVAVLTDRVPFLQRGLLPLGNMVSAVPVVGIAPIMVMWFGFGWESKAAVIVVMTFFPMLINTIAGLNASDHMERDLMRSYGSSYWQTFFMLRLPAALPFIFNALKINSTLALIGAIVAEMFGSPISGMGFRISTEVYKMNVDIVWATIAVAAVAGSAFYGLLALIERQLTFWHPSYRSRHTG